MVIVVKLPDELPLKAGEVIARNLVTVTTRQHDEHETSEVNILSFSYGDACRTKRGGVAELGRGELFSGPVRSPSASSEQGFQDTIRAPVVPPRSSLVRALASKRMVNIISIPWLDSLADLLSAFPYLCAARWCRIV